MKDYKDREDEKNARKKQLELTLVQVQLKFIKMEKV